ncbi:ribonuclease HIII [Mycoplasmopsis mucosicanis]|nr:ribonuclease HIII [Mycoplasmopsis mucosicanis]
MKFIEFNEQIDLKSNLIIGVDEVGAGEYFGPLIGAAVLIPIENKQKLINLGIKDSKALSDKKIIELAPKIQMLCEYGVYTLTPKGYNNLIDSYNANELKCLSHLKSIEKINSRADYIFIDQYSTLRSIEKYFERLLNVEFFALKSVSTDVILATKGEQKCLEVACASILARARLLQYQQQMSMDYGITFEKGSSNKTKEFAQWLWKNRPDINPYLVCKKNFKM